MGILLLITAEGFAQKQGIKGQVFRSPDQSPTKPSSTLAEPQFGLVCKVEIYKPTDSSQVTPVATSVYDSIRSEWVTETQTKADGSFKVKLPPGNYSVFVKVTNGLYSDQTDREGHIGLVKVPQRTWSWLPVVVENTVP